VPGESGAGDCPLAPGRVQGLSAPEAAGRPAMLSLVWDPANLMTLAGLACAGAALIFIARGDLTAAALLLVWAAGFDWFDGFVARALPTRRPHAAALGCQLDSLADLVSGGVATAMLSLAFADFAGWAWPGALALIVAGAVRLGYFNLFGAPDGHFVGLSIDRNIVVVAALVALEPWLGRSALAATLGGTVVALAALNVSPLRTPKLGGRWYLVYAGALVGFTALFGARLIG
jgi:CDP-diacylglycerol---serine O-phosphatidyltransferase